MTTVIANEALSSLLGPLKERTEIKDESGRLLGIFTPAEENLAEQKPYAEIRKLFDPEEIKRRKARSRNDRGRTVEQIMEQLRSREAGE